MTADRLGGAVETVLFDLDDTLVRYRRSPEELLQASYDACGLDPIFPVEEYYERFDELRDENDSIDALRSECFATLAADHGRDPSVGRELAATYAAMRDQSNVEFVPGARAVLDRLHGDRRLGIVTNGTADAQRAKIEAVDLDRWIDAAVFAGDSVAAKPDTTPFERALDRLDASPEATIHVGDSHSSDVVGANAAGIRSVWFADTAPDDHAAAYRIGSIEELLELLDGA